MPKPRSYTDEKLKQVVRDSISWSEVMRGLGLSIAGGTQDHLKSLTKRLMIDTSHLTGKKREYPAWNTNTMPLDKILVQDSPYKGKNQDLKIKLIKAKLLEDKCSECGILPLWNEKQLVLPLDHINGNNKDSRIENLRILCPNCHTQTETFSGRNRKSR